MVSQLHLNADIICTSFLTVTIYSYSTCSHEELLNLLRKLAANNSPYFLISCCYVSEYDFGANIDLTEEEQTRLLLEYEKECESKKLLQSNSERDTMDDARLLVPDVRDNHYSSCVSASRSEPSIASEVVSCQTNAADKGTNKREKLNRYGVKEEFSTDEPIGLKTKEKKDMVIVTDGNSCHTSSCSGDKGITVYIPF
jgi:hypothetical protein